MPRGPAAPKVSERLLQRYTASREVSKPTDLATLLLARLLYDPEPSRTLIPELLSALSSGQMSGLTGSRSSEFAHWLNGYLTVNRTQKGVSFYPVHPLLTLSPNGEDVRVRAFINALARCFVPAERDALCQVLWSPERQPAFERAIHDLLQWQMPSGKAISTAPQDRFAGCVSTEPTLSPDSILVRTKDDLLALARVEALGAQSYAVHAGRLIAFSLTRYFLAMAGVSFELPIYAAPAADTHEGVRLLAHEILDIHRKDFEETLHKQFNEVLETTLTELGRESCPADEQAARRLVQDLFDPRANIVPVGRYDGLLEQYDHSFVEIAYHYYWSRSGASSRFLRRLHTGQLNLAKKVGLANSRSRYNQWSYYWLAPSLMDTLLLISGARVEEKRVLLAKLLEDWRDRYGIAVLIDRTWEEAYLRGFRALGSPESLNEANLRRFAEILEEQGRLHKNSDEFPWVVLKD